MVIDKIGDYITRIRNILLRGKEEVIIPNPTKILLEISNILKVEGFINDYKLIDDRTNNKSIVLSLKYFKDGKSIIRGLRRVSKPGVRIYTGYKNISKVLSGQGIFILTTSKGILTGEKAIKAKIGGEVMCKIW